MSNQLFNIDDPGNVSRFINLMKGNKDSAQPGPANGEDTISKPFQPEVPAGNDVAVAQDHIAQLLVAASSALEGNTAPPKSANVSASDTELTDLTTINPLEEARLAILSTIAKSKQNLEDSKYAPKNRKSNANPATPKRDASGLPSFSNRFSPLGVEQPEMSPSTRSQPKVIAKFLKEQTLDGEKPAPSSTNLSSVMENHNPDAAVAALASKVASLKTERPGYPKLNTSVAPDHKKSPDEVNGEDREHLTHFSTWGTPQPRNRPASRVRKIILSNLPAGSDLTLVQSLVYGGAVENFDFMKPNKTSAWVIFVDADACDAFFKAHPNGIVFKNPKTCRDHVVYVGKGDVVDVVSSVLQAYLDCQASRVVRATGADEEWGMRALYKVAEAKNRKVEKIVDTYRNQVRTIIFRFTNIADAVGFRQQLMRDAGWEMCNVQFMADPVETATGVHLEE